MDGRPFIVLGGGGHAVVVVETLLALGARIEGVLDPRPDAAGGAVLGTPVLGDDGLLDGRDPATLVLANGIGSDRDTAWRRTLFRRFSERGFVFPNIVHPDAMVSPFVHLGHGVQVMPNAVIRPKAVIGDNVLVNTSVSIDHDARIDEGVHIAPGVVLSGNVAIGAGSHIGTGATIVQGVRIGAGCVVGAGAVVIRDVPAGATVVGNPARPLKPRLARG